MSEEHLMGKACFLDANIFLYAFIETQHPRKTEIAASILEGNEILLSTQVINEVCVNLIRKADFKEKTIQDLIFSFYRRYYIVEINEDILLEASDIRQRHTFSFWDSHIVAAASHADADILISEDMQHDFQYGNLKIYNPFLSIL